MSGWTLERRQKQAAAIHNWKPWLASTGPKTPEGKAKVARNAYRGGLRPDMRKLAKVLKEQDQQLEGLNSTI